MTRYETIYTFWVGGVWEQDEMVEVVAFVTDSQKESGAVAVVIRSDGQYAAVPVEQLSRREVKG